MLWEQPTPHILYKLSKAFSNLSFHPKWVVFINILQIVVIIKVFDDLWGVTEALNDTVHEASVAKVAETTDPWLCLVTETTITIGSRSPTKVVPAGGSASTGSPSTQRTCFFLLKSCCGAQRLWRWSWDRRGGSIARGCGGGAGIGEVDPLVLRVPVLLACLGHVPSSFFISTIMSCPLNNPASCTVLSNRDNCS